jgi:hypothetical protein
VAYEMVKPTYLHCTVFALKAILYKVTQYRLYCTVYTGQVVLYRNYATCYSVQAYTAELLLYKLHCTDVCTGVTAQDILYTAEVAMYRLHCTDRIVLYSLCRTGYSVQVLCQTFRGPCIVIYVYSYNKTNEMY